MQHNSSQHNFKSSMLCFFQPFSAPTRGQVDPGTASHRKCDQKLILKSMQKLPKIDPEIKQNTKMNRKTIPNGEEMK